MSALTKTTSPCLTFSKLSCRVSSKTKSANARNVSPLINGYDEFRAVVE